AAPEPDAEPEPPKDETGNSDLDELVEIAPNTYWIGRRDGTLLERNIYLRVFSDGDKTINMLIDPGPPRDLSHLISILSPKIGGIDNLHLIFLNHQDPDVAFNAGHLQKLNPNCVILCSEDSWRLVQFYGLNPEKYKPVEFFNDLSVEMSTGQRIHFIPSPYCHFRGAVMLYDEETDILFSGDLLGGISFKPDLYATEDSWDGISTFHQIYMSSQAAIRHALSNIRNIVPLPKIIAPQHGGIITGDLVDDFLTRLTNLEVGIDLFLKEHTKKSYISAMNDLITNFSKKVDSEIIHKTMNAFLSDGSFPNAISVGANGVFDIKINPFHAFSMLLRELRSNTPPEIWEVAEISILRVLTKRKITIPDYMLLNASDQMLFFLEDMFTPGKPEDSAE
ncbi:MAG: MBL fold metallo-hydrolase, partial [Candidatus Fermentibacteria bacterium]